MDERQFKTLLKQSLDEEIPTVNLWEPIAGKLPMRANRAARYGLRLSRLPLTAVMVLMLAAVAYAFYQGGLLPSDPGVDSIAEADLLTTYDETKPVMGAPEEYGLTVTLDYAYADANRVTVGYTVNGTSPDDRRLVAHSNPNLMAGGQPLERLMLLASDQIRGEPTEEGGSSFTSQLTANFITAGLDADEGDTLSLQLMVEVALSELGTGEFPAPGMFMAGMTEFTFDVPYLGGTTIELGREGESVGTNIELQRVVVSPSMTRLEMCYDLPDLQAPPAWSPFITITVDGEQVFTGHTETYGLETAYDVNEDCRGVVIPAALEAVPGAAWEVAVTGFTDFSAAGSEAIPGEWAFGFTIPEQ